VRRTGEGGSIVQEGVATRSDRSGKIGRASGCHHERRALRSTATRVILTLDDVATGGAGEAGVPGIAQPPRVPSHGRTRSPLIMTGVVCTTKSSGVSKGHMMSTLAAIIHTRQLGAAYNRRASRVAKNHYCPRKSPVLTLCRAPHVVHYNRRSLLSTAITVPWACLAGAGSSKTWTPTWPRAALTMCE
jgi:hypothetical protein